MGINSFDLYCIAKVAMKCKSILRINYTDGSFVMYGTSMFKRVTNPAGGVVAFVKQDGTHTFVHSLDRIISIGMSV